MIFGYYCDSRLSKRASTKIASIVSVVDFRANSINAENCTLPKRNFLHSRIFSFSKYQYILLIENPQKYVLVYTNTKYIAVYASTSLYIVVFATTKRYVAVYVCLRKVYAST